MKELTSDDLLAALAVESFEKRHGMPPEAVRGATGTW